MVPHAPAVLMSSSSRSDALTWAPLHALAELLKAARKRRGLTQEQVALTAEVDTETYRVFELTEDRHGKEANPRLVTLMRVCWTR